MANVKKAEPTVNETKRKKYMVIARSPETMKEGYAIVNAGGIKAKRIPFETPVMLTDKEVAVIKRQRESIQVDAELTVYQIMEKYKMSQEKANRMIRQINSDKDMGGKRIDWVARYIVTPA
jgi:hypothetical protein